MADNTPTPSDMPAKKDAEAPADTTDATESQTPEMDAAEGDSGDSKDLRDAGKRALDAMKEKEKSARKRAAVAEEERDRLKAAAEGREAEWEAERKADAERETKFRDKYLRAEIKTAAKGTLFDIEDAFRYLDLSEFAVGDDGDVDTEAVQAAIASLVESKPYLAVQDGTGFTGSADAGPRNADKPTQLTEADLSRMVAAGDDDGIAKAKAEGRLNGVLGIKAT